MNLMLYKDGRLVISEQGKPLEGDDQNLDGLYAYITDPKDGDSIVYDAASGTWKTGAGGGGSFSPDITDPQDGQTLVYDATAGKWVNGAGGGGNMVVPMTIEEDTPVEHSTKYTLNASWQDISAAIAAGKYVCYISSGEQIVQGRIVSYYSYELYGTTLYGIGDYQDNFYETDSQTGYPWRVEEPWG